MSCILQQQEGGGTVAVMSFNRERLLYDIENNAHIEGDAMESEDGHSRHLVQDIAEEGNIDRVLRVVDLSIAECREMLYCFTKYDVDRPELDNALNIPESYGIVLTLPSGFSQTTLNLLERQVHEYVVCKAVADWMSITHPDRVEGWAAKAASAKTWIQTKLQARTGRTRRPMHPF
ncbi:MAG: hypothetical protein K2M80_05765 [Muribaculaceae bacterium]|nr:hypothetical protein [Muribaculaceae bacterium]